MEQRADQLKALADPLRLRLLELLHERGETCVCELVDALGTSQANVSTHLRVLRAAGLVHSQKIGKWVFYRLDQEGLGGLLRWLGEHLAPETCGCHRAPDALYQICCAGETPRSREAAAQALAGGCCRGAGDRP
ncbi:MAG: helix-turn-helix transcriptional regulator [Armatimonadetes bacterium]|nr:helix-turn-helix transcriptional regulator [Armatimonadota bacterium]